MTLKERLIQWKEQLQERYPSLVRLEERAKRFTLPGFENVPLYDVAVFFFNEVKRDVLPVRSKSIAFSFFLAMFPGMIFAFTLLPYIPIEGLKDQVLTLVSDIFPTENSTITAQVESILKRRREGLLSLGFFFAIYFSSNGVIAMMDSFDKSYANFRRRNVLMKRWIALRITFVLFGMLVLAAALIVLGDQLLSFLLQQFNIFSQFSVLLANMIKYVIILVFFFFSISIIYYYAPAVKKKFKFISAGSTLATVLIIIISLIFSWFLKKWNTYNLLYGSLGTIIAILLWLNLISFALLIGFELNTAITYNKNLREEGDDGETT